MTQTTEKNWAILAKRYEALAGDVGEWAEYRAGLRSYPEPRVGYDIVTDTVIWPPDLQFEPHLAEELRIDVV